MTNTPEPSTFLAEQVSEQATWRWRLEDAAGAEIEVPDLATAEAPRFLSQGDAESWVGEFWRDLAGGGVTGVTLFDADREVYGPMSLQA